MTVGERVGKIVLSGQNKSQKDLKGLLGTLGVSQLISGRGTEGVCSMLSWPASAQALVATVISQDKKERSWLVVAGSVREQEELASEIEAWGGEVLIIPEAHRGEERVRPDPDLEAEWLGSLARLVQGKKPRLVIVTERVL